MISSTLTSLSSRIARVGLPVYGKTHPVIVVNEFPKSGGTWFARMLASATGLPFVDNSVLPVAAPSIIRTHWEPSRSYPFQIYVVRDGRDVMVSWYHHRLKHLDSAALRRRYAPLGELSADNISEKIDEFMEFEFRNPGAGVARNWNDHVVRGIEAAGGPDSPTVVRYEDLTADPATVLHRVLSSLFDIDVDGEVIDSAIGANSRGLTKQREVFNARQRSFVRSAGSSPWPDVFDDAALATFERYASDAMSLAGYSS